MLSPSRRDVLTAGLTAAAGLALAADPPLVAVNVHRQLLDLAAECERRRKARFAAVSTPAELETLQKDLRRTFLELIDGLPQASGPPPVRLTGRTEADGYTIDKLAYESFPGYFVSALLYRPTNASGPRPGVLSPCGHSATGKAAGPYQTLHVNLAKRGFVVLTYDPVGQGERSQFWDEARQRSRFNLACGEHAVLGNPLYLLGTSLARYRIWDGMRGLDYLASVPGVDADRLGCVGNSGGGTLTAYIAALDPRVKAAAICCYITTLPRRMGNRIETDPDADPEQDVFGFVSEGIDHAGLLALRAPRPTLLGTARYDFFPIEGARESFAEAKRLFEVVGAGDRIARVEAEEKHGLSHPLRQAVYAFFDHWLLGRTDGGTDEVPVTPRSPKELQVCDAGQVNVSFHSRPLLTVAVEGFRRRPKAPRVPLKELLHPDPEGADFRLTAAAAGTGNGVRLLCVNGVESADWSEERAFVRALSEAGYSVSVLDPRGVGRLAVPLALKGHGYADPLCGVEENVAYNAFMVGRSLLGMRVTDVLAAVARLRPTPVVLVGRRDAALVCCLAAALEPVVVRVAVEGMLPSYWPLFDPAGRPVNAASILPRMLRDFGDIPDVLAQIGPRPVLLAAPQGEVAPKPASVRVTEKRLTEAPELLLDWLRG
jgi:dienelactone hydrolase